MTRDDIIRMAREAGIECLMVRPEDMVLHRFAALVAAHEREACKRAFDAYLLTSDPGPLRARGNA